MRLLILFLVLFVFSAYAEVVDESEHGFVSEHVLILAGSPQRVYTALTADIHLWWDASHSYGGQARTFTLDARAGGCFCEALAAGGSVEHMHVVNAQPGRSLTLQGGLGPLQNMGVAGSMLFALEAAEGGTQLTYRYIVGGFQPGGLAVMAEPVDRVQLGQLKRLQQYLDSGEALNK